MDVSSGGVIIDNDTIKYNVSGEIYVNSSLIIPIGAVIPWLKTFTGTPELPSGFLECDGSVVNDSNSVYHGATLPNLNGSNYFLRGSSTSGGTGGTTQHRHDFTVASESTGGGSTQTTGREGSGVTQYEDNLPPYYNIVFIIRIK